MTTPKPKMNNNSDHDDDIEYNKNSIRNNSNNSKFWNDINNKIKSNIYKHKVQVEGKDAVPQVDVDNSVGNDSKVKNNNNNTVKEATNNNCHWIFRSRTSHILNTNGHYDWKRELHCFQGQSLPDAVYNNNTVEIIFLLQNSNSNLDNCNEKNAAALRIRFSALEGLRNWMSYDCQPILTYHAIDSNLHWKQMNEMKQTPTAQSQKGDSNNSNPNPSSSSIINEISYDYTYTTPYKGGTDCIYIYPDDENNDNDNDDTENNDDTIYNYLKPDSSSFIAKHDAEENNDTIKKNSNNKSGNSNSNVRRVKLRKPICKCKGDGGRAPFVSTSTTKSRSRSKNDIEEVGREVENRLSSSQSKSKKGRRSQPQQQSQKQLPEWKKTISYKVDIEGLLQRNHTTIKFRDDITLWEDDLHDNGTAWLKVRTFVCKEGWACLLRNYIRVDNVLVRVIDTRYIHIFGSPNVYREYSYKEGTWKDLIKKINTNPKYPTTQTIESKSSISLESINDSIAAKYLPLKEPPITEYLSLLLSDNEDDDEIKSVALPLPSPFQEDDEEVQQQKETTTAASAAVTSGDSESTSLIIINDVSIEDAIPVVPNLLQEFGIAFLTKKSNGSILEAISTTTSTTTASALSTTDVSSSSYISSTTIWSKPYNSHKNGTTKSILSIQISSSPYDGGRIAIGDDYGYVETWRLLTGELLYKFDITTFEIRNKYRNKSSTRLWTDHLIFNDNGSYIGASAGRNTVLIKVDDNNNNNSSSSSSSSNDEENCCIDGQIVSSLESTSGTVTGLAFRNNENTNNDVLLAVASYGEIQWLATSTATPTPTPTPLKRNGAAIECIDISSNGQKIAVGFLDKTLRVYDYSPTTTTDPEKDVVSNKYKAIDWVGFNSAVKSVQFSTSLNSSPYWLAAMGGNTILVLRDDLNTRKEAPIICRTQGKTERDGCDGTCHRFINIQWSTSTSTLTTSGFCQEMSTLAALDANNGSVHIFHFIIDNNNTTGNTSRMMTTSNHNQIEDSWPRRALPVYTIQSSFLNPSKSIATTVFAFFPSSLTTTLTNTNTSQQQEQERAPLLEQSLSATKKEVQQQQRQNAFKFMILDTATTTDDDHRDRHQHESEVSSNRNMMNKKSRDFSLLFLSWKATNRSGKRKLTSCQKLCFLGFVFSITAYYITSSPTMTKKEKTMLTTSISMESNYGSWVVSKADNNDENDTIITHPEYDEEEARKYLFYSKVAFCTEQSILSWSCGYMCNKVPIISDDDDAPDNNSNNNNKVRYIPEGESYGVQGYVAQIPNDNNNNNSDVDGDNDNDDLSDHDGTNNNKCIVSFRGSLNTKNWYADFLFMLKPWPTGNMIMNMNLTDGEENEVDWCRGCKAHYGFASAYDELRNEVHDAIQDLNCTSLVVSGHSLGGAIATIASFDLRAVMGYHVESTWTYGKPRLGNVEFANSFVAAATKQGVSSPIWRIVHFHDPVPRAPPNLPFHPIVHAPLEIYYTNRQSSEYIVCPQQNDGTKENQSSSCMGSWPLYLSLNIDHINYLNESFAFKNFPADCKAMNNTAPPRL